MIPSALENHKHNQGKADKQIKTFEIANCYQKTEGQELPKEISYLAILSEGDYRKTKGDLEALFQKLRVKDISFEPSKVLPPFYNTVATADIYSEKLMIGYIGSIKSAVSRNFGLTNSLIATEINLDSLVSKISQEYVYHPISEYPSIIEDLTVASEKSLGDIIEAIKSTSKLVKDIQYLDSFKGKHSFRISFQNNEKNLEQAEINSLKEIILDLFKV